MTSAKDRKAAEVRQAIQLEKERKRKKEQEALQKGVEERAEDLQNRLKGYLDQRLGEFAAALMVQLQKDNQIHYGNMVELAKGQTSIENQYMAIIRFVLSHVNDLGHRLNTYLRSLGYGGVDPVEIADVVRTVYAPELAYDDLIRDMDFWYDLRTRPDFKEYLEDYCSGRLTKESLLKLPPPKGEQEITGSPLPTREELAAQFDELKKKFPLHVVPKEGESTPAEPSPAKNGEEPIGTLVSLEELDAAAKSEFGDDVEIFGAPEAPRPESSPPSQ